MASVTIELTSRCNLACAMCCHPVLNRPKADMPWARFVSLVADIRDNGHRLQGIQWFGEPLLAERFLDAIRFLRQEGVLIRNAFYTNAMLLTPEMTDCMLEAGFGEVCAKTRKVWLGVDTLSPDVYAQLRIGGDWNTVVQNAQYFCERMRRRLRGLKVQRLLTRYNPGEPEGPFESFFGVPVATRKVGVHCDKARDLTVEPFVADERSQCRELYGTVYVASDGGVTSCCIDGDLSQPCGHADRDAIADIASGAARRKQQAAFQAGEYGNLPLCATCLGSEMRGR